MKADRKIRVLHVVGAMNPGGIEAWLMRVLRHADRDRLHMDFMVHTTAPCAYDEEIRDLGSDVLPCPAPRNPWAYPRGFAAMLDIHGPYDVVHGHVFFYSGNVMRLAHRAGVPVRVAHSHTTGSQDGSRTAAGRRVYEHTMRHWIYRHATLGLADCPEAAEALFGSGWRDDVRWHLIPCSIELDAFRTPVDKAQVRRELGLRPDALVIGHVGRFHPVKNHGLIIETAREVMQRVPDARLVLIGDGSLRPDIEARAAELGIADNVIFTGLRSDVARVMRGAMDVVMLPSHYESVPVVAIEAQAAGVPIVVSSHLTEELELVQPLVHRVPVEAAPSVWAERVLAAARQAGSAGADDAFSVIERSAYNLPVGISELAALYAGGAPACA